jgi:hypothetical protein
MPRFALLAVLTLIPGSLAAQEIPVDFFPGVTFDAPVPARLATGETVPVSGTVAEPGPEGAITLSFEPDGTAALSTRLEVATSVVDGRFELVLRFDHPLLGTYALEVFNGFTDEDYTGALVGRFESVVVEAGDAPFARQFDDIEFTEPVPASLTTGQVYVFTGDATDPETLALLLVLESFDGETVVELGFTSVMLGAFELPIEVPAGVGGDFLMHAAVLLVGNRIESRGSLAVQVSDASPVAEVGLVALSLIPGSSGFVPVINRGVGALELSLDAVDGPFEVITFPNVVEPGQMATIEVAFTGDVAAHGQLSMQTNDPGRPTLVVALTGTPAAQPGFDLTRVTADAAGVLRVELDFGERDHVVAVFPAQTERFEDGRAYSVAFGDPQVSESLSALRSPPLTGRDAAEAARAQQEARLARRLAESGIPYAAKRAAVDYQPGDERTFAVPADVFGSDHTLVGFRVVAVNDRVVAFVDTSLELSDFGVDADLIAERIDEFADGMPIVETHFGPPSDVDGDGKVAVLLVADLIAAEVGGLFSPESLLPVEVGGTGDLTDIVFIEIDQLAYPEVRILLTHEYAHLIGFNQKVLVRRGLNEVSWLGEALSAIAEDLIAGLVANSNYDHVVKYLQAPARISLGGNIVIEDQDGFRGAGHLFVRGLVEQYGPEVLLRLVQTDKQDTDNVEAATGAAFDDLLARFAAQVYLSGGEAPSHPWFHFNHPPLTTSQGRGMPLPVQWRHRVGEAATEGAVAWRGVGYARVTGEGVTTLEIGSDPDGRLEAVVIPVAKVTPVAELPTDVFRGVRLDRPLPTQLSTGRPLTVSGSVDDPSVSEIELSFAAPGREPFTFFFLVNSGRFERTLVLGEDLVGHRQIDAIGVGNDEPYLGGSVVVSIIQGDRVPDVPARYFNDVSLDEPLPRDLPANGSLTVSGSVRGEGITDVSFVFWELVETHDPIQRDIELPVTDGRFNGELDLTGLPPGAYLARMWKFGDHGWTNLGAAEVTVIPVETVVLDTEVLPTEVSLAQNYPNPFNPVTTIRYELPRRSSVDLAVYNLAGQRVATLSLGDQPAGFHAVTWDGRDNAGGRAASGVYVYRLTVGDRVEQRKLLLLQ